MPAMANAQIMQDELQQSVLLSEGDAEPDANTSTRAIDEDPDSADAALPADAPDLKNERDKDEIEDDRHVDDEVGQDYDHRHGEMLNYVNALQEDKEREIDAEPEEYDDEEAEEIDIVEAPNVDDADALSDDDDEEEAEGVGAVKIRPGETDDDDESEDDSSAADASDAESEAEWAEAVETGPDGEEDEDEESEVEEQNLCMFCKKDEENDPGEDFESFLVCKVCGEHAHQQCARDENAMGSRNGDSKSWKCRECTEDDEDDDDQMELDNEAASSEPQVNGKLPNQRDNDDEGDEAASPASRRSNVSKIAHEIGLLPPPSRGAIKPDSHSVFNQLVLDEDPMDGSRVLRKRKNSSAEVDMDEEAKSIPKRRRNTNDPSVLDETGEDKEPDDGVRPRSSRSLRPKTLASASIQITSRARGELKVKFSVDPEELGQILTRAPKLKKRGVRAGGRSARAAAGRTTQVMEPVLAPSLAPSYTQPFYSFYDKDTDELKAKPYGGILTEAEADTSKTLPTKEDRRKFDEAKQKADAEWRNRLLAMQAEMDVPVKRTKKASGPVSQIECIEFGGWEIDTWYAAPYPEEYSRNRVLYICEFCLKYMNSDYVAWRHKLKCPAKHPPGDEIYRQGNISFFEVDGRKNPVYCQNLCLLAKLFLGSKTLYYDVEPFLFYVLCEYDDMGYHFVGYFSKEKRASSQNNVSCILTLPIHQRKGYGNLLIDLSYLLTRVEKKNGSPEKPLSDMGLVSYRNYWRLIMCRYLVQHTPTDKSMKKGLSVRQISDDTGMMPDDVISALEGLRCLVRDPQTQVYAFRVDLVFCREHLAKWESKGYVKLNENALTWTPYVMGRSNATNFELGPALTAIAPREEDDDTKAVQILAESGIATGDFANLNSVGEKPLDEPANTILESTEPNDNAPELPAEPLKSLDDGKENGEPLGGEEVPTALEVAAPGEEANVVASDDWMKPYGEIPVTRFEVFPPANSKRPGAPRTASALTRALHGANGVSAAPRPRPRRSVGGRKAASRSKSSGSTRRKTGGTGRGPGRWPKGTKKSDYGNAESGPGLPPAWLERDKQRQSGLTPSNAGTETQDTVEVGMDVDGAPKKDDLSRAEDGLDDDAEADEDEENGDDSEDGEEEEEEEEEEEDDDDEDDEEKAEDDPDVVMGEDEEEDEDEDAEGEDEDAEGEDE